MALAPKIDTILYNAVQSGGRIAYAGVRVQAYVGDTEQQLYDANGDAVSVVTTDVNGRYEFWIEEGRYTLRFSFEGTLLSAQTEDIYNSATWSFGYPTRAAFVAALSLMSSVNANGQTVKAAGLNYIRQSGATAIPDLPGWVPSFPIYAGHFGFVGNGTLADTALINTAIAYVGGAGGGTVHLPGGTLDITNTNPAAASWDNYRAIYFGVDDVMLKGAGKTATKLRLVDGADCHVIQFGQRVTSVVTVSDCGVSDLEIDGNRANQTLPSDPDDHWAALAVSSNCERITGRDLYIHDIQYYGIGGQRTGIKNCHFERILIENTGADGIDWKNDDSDGYGNVFSGITARNPGLATVLSLAETAFDFRSGVFFENLTADSFAAESDLVGLRIQVDGNSTDAIAPPYPTSGRGVKLVGSNGASGYGLRISARNTIVTEVNARGFSQMCRVSAPDCKVSNFNFVSDKDGIVLTNGTAAGASTCCFTTGTIRSGTGDGIRIEGVNTNENEFIGVDVRSNTTGYDIMSGAADTRFIGGSNTGNTTALSDAGTGTLITDVSGLRTSGEFEQTVAIDSTGVKNIIFPHGMVFTPNVKSVALTLSRDTNVGDWSSGFLWVSGTDATNVYAQLRVLTASAAVGATVKVIAKIKAKAAQ